LEQIKPVKGKAPKRPPLTHDAKQEIDQIHRALDDVRYRVGMLYETALKGFAFEALRLAEVSDELKDAWKGVAALAEHHRELKARHRTGRGNWYAVIRFFYHRDGMATEAFTTHEFWRTRKAARRSK
jgi:hypothetical protein